LPVDAGPIRGEVDVRIDEAGEHEAIGKVDEGRAGGRGLETVLHRLDAAVANDDGRLAARLAARPVEQRAGMNDGEPALGLLRRGGRPDQQEKNERKDRG
jgi:hypothetical protein